MSIWLYKDISSTPHEYTWGCAINRVPHPYEVCPSCQSKLMLLGKKHVKITTDRSANLEVWVCQTCGWWSTGYFYNYDIEFNDESGWYEYKEGFTHGLLKSFSPIDIDQPTDEVLRYIVAKEESLKSISPRLVEQTVNSVFKNLGYSTEITPLIGDNGIDLYVLNDKNERQIGIQVKRWNRKISIEQIHSFFGALVINQLTKGIFVATKGFTPGAKHTVKKVNKMNMVEIDLKDGDWLINSIKLTLRPCYEDIDDPEAPFYSLLKNPSTIPSDGISRRFD